MRAIKFKAKRVSDGEWVEGCYYVSNERHFIKHPKSNTADEIGPNTLCQFTGLTDKNGKEIWEGDILKQTNFDGEEYEATYVVVWSVGSYAKKMIKRNDVEIESTESSFSFEIYHQDQGRCRKELVVGNIHNI